jgi:hypothetical protein
MIRHQGLLAVAASAAAIVFGLAAPATAVAPAVEGTFTVEVNGCSVLEEIELQGSPAHDYMRWETSTAQGCTVAIHRNGVIIEEQTDLTGGYHHSDWYYDGPGDTEMVCLSNGETPEKCGQSN